MYGAMLRQGLTPKVSAILTLPTTCVPPRTRRRGAGHAFGSPPALLRRVFGRFRGEARRPIESQRAFGSVWE
jgi:hypothetical protein